VGAARRLMAAIQILSNGRRDSGGEGMPDWAFPTVMHGILAA